MYSNIIYNYTMAMGRIYKQKRTRGGRPKKYINRTPKFGSIYRVVNKVINKSKEHKYLEGVISTDPTTTGTFTLLNGVAQGDDVNTREGNKIKMSSIYIKGYSKNTDVDTTKQARYVLFIDTQPNLAAPTEALLFADNIAPEDGSLFNPLNKRRFVILKDWFFNCASPGEAGNTKIINYYKKLFGETNYIDGNATIASINKNSLYLYMTSSDDSGGFNGSLDYRFRFTD